MRRPYALMRLPETRFTTTVRRRGLSVALLVVLAVVAAGITGAVLWFTRAQSPLLPVNAAAVSEQSLFDLWNERRFEELIEASDTILEQSPLDSTALALRGFAFFYRAMDEIDVEERQALLSFAVQDLRRALLNHSHPLRVQINYVLGKTYFHRGQYYQDLALESLQTARDGGMDPVDSYEYMGLAARALGRVDEAVGYFTIAVERSRQPIHVLTLAETLMEDQRWSEAEHYFRLAAESSEETVLRQQALLSLGRVMRLTERYSEALEIYLAVVEENPSSAEARFGMGEVYLALGDNDRARFEWREAVRRNPNHIESLQRLREY